VVATVGPVGFKDLGRGSRVHVQFATEMNGPFTVNVLGTLDFDFASNVGSNWFDMTNGLLLNQEDDELGFFDTNGKFQHRRKKKDTLFIGSEGVYAFDSDFLPAALLFNVTSVSSGDNLKILIGV